MIKQNPALAQLSSNYLFSEINKRKQAYLKEHPNADLISLGIGDTTEPIGEHVVKAMMHAAVDQGVRERYQGYGPEIGLLPLREKIAEHFYQGALSPHEIFVSDGAKCDVGRLQLLLGPDVSVGIQDPTYPVYLDGSLLNGVQNIHLMPCTPECDFFPDLKALPNLDVLYICSPNNPTGSIYTFDQLKQLVDYAYKTKTLLLFDAAYSSFIQDSNLPRSIFEIEGAKEVAIEIQSFSKSAGFTGLRLGFTAISDQLKYSNGKSLGQDFKRVTSTLFNGASIISQKGGLAALEPQGLEDSRRSICHYMDNASLLKRTLESLQFKVYGGEHAPYLWVHVPHLSSWEAFDLFLNHTQILTTPGSGFGKAGEGFIRLSAFASKESVEKATQRIKEQPHLLSALLSSSNR